MRSNFFNFTKMQISSLSQVVWLQLLGVAFFPMFFTQLNANIDIANTLSYATGLLMLSYLILRNFMFNDAKYKTKLLFSILPITPGTVIGARGLIVYLFCLIASPLLILFSNITYAVKPAMFAVVQPQIMPYGLILVAVFLPIELLIFNLFEGQKADIIGALVIFPYMGIMALLCKYFMHTSFWIVVLIIAILTNVVCYRFSAHLYTRDR